MTEQEKRDRIIERLDRCSGEITCNDCSRVRFCEELDVYRVCQDAIVLLKAQEPVAVIPAIKKDGELLREGNCPVCGMKLDWFYNGNYCGCCGKPVKWE